MTDNHKEKISNSLLKSKLVGKYDKSMSNNPRSKKVLEIDESGSIIHTYDCGKEVAIKYNIIYSTFKTKMRNGLIINKNKFIWS